MTCTQRVDGDRLAGVITATSFEGWSDDVREEFSHNAWNTKVGSELLAENERVRVWSINLSPGERLEAHRHCLDYFWTSRGGGTGLQHIDDGTTRRVTYAPARHDSSRSSLASTCSTIW